jgi:hypothetical protein
MGAYKITAGLNSVRIAAVLSLALSCAAQDQFDWQSLATLLTGDRVRLTLRSHKPVTGTYKERTGDQITVDAIVANKADLVKVERYGRGWGRGKPRPWGRAWVEERA